MTLTLLFHESLFNFLLLLLSYAYHNLLEPRLHFLTIVLFFKSFSLGPWVLDGLLKSEAMFRLRI